MLGFCTLQRTRGTKFRALAMAIGFVVSGSALAAATVPPNLGYGLDKLVESDQAIRAARGAEMTLFQGYATEQAAWYGTHAITEADSGRVKVDLTLNGRQTIDELQASVLAGVPSFTVTSVDRRYRAGTGVLEGWVAVDEVPQLAGIKGVRGVFLQLMPEVEGNLAGTSVALASDAGVLEPAPSVAPGSKLRKLGSAFDQGVIQHRVDRVNKFYNPFAPVNFDGAGISVGAISDSYDTRTAGNNAIDGVNGFDLPGSPSHPLNTQPVVVLQDLAGAGTDEGRGMVEIVHKMAPRARLAFATGGVGEVEFGNNIRALAGLPGFTLPPNVQQGFAAQVIVDDLSIGGEPFFGESIIGQAIDDVTATGVNYFSSAGNNIGINAYASPLRWVANGTGVTAATNSALVGTNIDLTGVPAALYQGGFHNFNPGAGLQDVAQLVNMPAAFTGVTDMQWDDPYDARPPVVNQPPIFSSGGTSTAGSSVTFDGASSPALPTFTAGTLYVITETAGATGDFDGIVTVFDPSNNQIISQDTVVDEVVSIYAPVTGQYRIVIAPFVSGGIPTAGPFTVTVNTASGTPLLTSELSLLVFRADTGAFVPASSLTANNLANNRPVELGAVGSPAGQTQVQFVVARSGVPGAAQVPTRFRWQTRGNGAAGIGPAEYFSYNTTTSKGHASARGTNSTAAYSAFRPNTPETFTSPGPATILFDFAGNRLAAPELREIPRVAAIDNANTHGFPNGGDSANDLDASPNFSGTSAAAPHAAGIAAIVLQSRGGPNSITPAQLRTILQTKVFPHDLDPSFASGTATATNGAVITVSVSSDGNSNTATGQNDVNSIRIAYTGAGSLASITFNPAGTAATGGNVTSGNNGPQDDAASSPPTITFFENNFPGLVFLPATKAFTLGTLTGITALDIVPPLSIAPFTGFSNLAPAPSNGTSHFWTMAIGFPTGQFGTGDEMRFTVGRGAQHSANVVQAGALGPTGGQTTVNPLADLFGGAVSLPSGVVIADGMAFSGTLTGGGTFSGVIRNNIGTGYSNVDGYGLIDAAAASFPDGIFADSFE